MLVANCGLAMVRGVYAQERCDGRILEQRPRHAHRPQRLPLLVYVDESGRYEWHGYEEQGSCRYDYYMYFSCSSYVYCDY